MKRMCIVVGALGVAASLGAFEGRERDELEEKRQQRFAFYSDCRPKGKGERKRTRGDWSNSRGRQSW